VGGNDDAEDMLMDASLFGAAPEGAMDPDTLQDLLNKRRMLNNGLPYQVHTEHDE
jgi:hypothetical protein